MSTDTTKPRGRYALSLRAFLILVLVLGGGFGWTVNWLKNRRSSVDAVRKVNGTVFFDYQFKNGQPLPIRKPWPPLWLVRHIPEEFFHDVTVINNLDFSRSEAKDASAAMGAIRTFDRLERLQITNPPPGTMISGLDRLKVLEVSLTRPGGELPIRVGPLASVREVFLGGPGVNDSMLSDLASLTSVREIRLSMTSITDAGLARLDGLTELEVLWLTRSKVTDAGLKSLVRLKKLEVLDLIGNPDVTDDGVRFLSVSLPGLKHLLVSATGVTDASLVHLTKFAGLEGLQIAEQGAKITDAGLASLARLTHLEVLNVRKSGVTDAGLEHLQGLKKLRWLDLSATSVTDTGLGRLAEIKSLRWLNLNDTPITDAGLGHLSRLAGLEHLYLDETHVTDAGLKRLCGLKSLKSVVIGGTGVSADGIANLRAALPPSTLLVRMGKGKVPQVVATPIKGP